MIDRLPSDPVVGTPERLRQPGRAVPITAETPDLVADLEQINARLHRFIAPTYADPADLLNELAEYGWQIVRLP